MVALPRPVDDQARLLLQTVWDQLASGDHWPTYGVVDRVLHRQHRLDVDELLQRISEQLLVGGRASGSAPPAQAEQLRLTIAGVAACEGTDQVVDVFLRGVRLAARLEEEYPGDADEPALTADQLIEGASDGGRRGPLRRPPG